MTMSEAMQDCIREMDRDGVSQREISRRLHVGRNTVRRYLSVSDLSPRPRRDAPYKSPTMEPWAATVDSWLEADLSAPPKQRHTTNRIYERLVELGFRGSRSTVGRYVRHWRKEHGEGRPQMLELAWPAGWAQADFGHATATLGGEPCDLLVLVVTFPHSNARFCRAALANRSECLCDALQAIFGHVGGVAPVVVLDNATEGGRRVGDVVTESRLFTQFRLHMGFEARYCNPHAGHEKGSVENAVGFLRRNAMVPPPDVADIHALNAMLLSRCDALLEKAHYRRKPATVGELFEEDRRALLELPRAEFRAFIWKQRTADKLGRVKADGVFYTVGPYWSGWRLNVGLGAFSVEVEDLKGRHLATLPRCFAADGRTVCDPTNLLGAVSRRPRSWELSQLRAACPEPVRTGVDRLGMPQRRHVLKDVSVVAASVGFKEAVGAAAILFEQGRVPDLASMDVLARRLPGSTGHQAGPDLAVYDRLAGR